MTDNNNNTVEITSRHPGQVDPESVKDFLLENPDFFYRYPILLEQLNIPHAQRGTVSLVELQGQQLRQKVQELQEKISQLMSVAKQNERIYRIYADLNLRLFHCQDIDSVLAALRDVVCEQLSLQAVSLRILGHDSGLPDEQQGHFVEHRFRGENFFFGRLNQQEMGYLFKQEGIKSVALMQLKQEHAIGVIAIGSSDEGHFYPGMDTLLIQQLQQLLSLLLPQLLQGASNN